MRWSSPACLVLALAGCGAADGEPGAAGDPPSSAACRVVATSPAFDAVDVPIVGELAVEWSTAVDPASLVDRVVLSELGGDVIPTTVAVTGPDRITIAHDESLHFWGSYTLRILDGVTTTDGAGCEAHDMAFSSMVPEPGGRPLRAAAADGLARVGDIVLTVSRTYRGLQVYDASDRAAVVLLGEVPTAEEPEGIVVDGTRAYVPCGWGGVLVFDVSDPADPRLLGRVGTPGYARDAAAYEHGGHRYLAVADAHAGVRIADVTDGAAPIDLGGFDPSEGPGEPYVWAVDVQGGLLAIADDVRGLTLASLDDPESPLLVGRIEAEYKVFDVVLDGPVAYASLGPLGIRSFDIADPAAPVAVQLLPGPNGPCTGIPCWDFMQGLTLSEGELLAGTGTVGAARIAVDGAGGMALLAAFDAPGKGYAVTGDASTLFVGSEGGLITFDRAGASGASPLWQDAAAHGMASAVRVADGHAYVASGGRGLKTFSLEDPTLPTLIDQQDTPGVALNYAAQNITLAPGVLVVSDVAGGTTLFDVTDPAHPAVLSTLAPDDNVVAAVLDGDNLFVCQTNAGMLVADIGVPASPVELTRTAVPPDGDPCYDLRLAGHLLYIGGGRGVGVVDVSDPAAPQWLGWSELPTRDIVKHIEVVGAYLFASSVVVDWEGEGSVAHRLDVFSLADPVAPELIWRSDELGDVGELLVAGDTAFLATGAFGVAVWDIGAPAFPVRQGSIETPGSAAGLALVGESLLVAQGAGGLLSIHLGPVPEP